MRALTYRESMKSQFSEFTYGYALVEEMSRDYRFSAVPIFPSLIEEGRTGGYDVGLNIRGMPFFLQFKRSDYLSRSNSKYNNSFHSPYYRFNLHALRHSRQHNLLLHLERSGNPVFYVAPKFHENTELHDNYFNSNVASESIWIAPTEIGNLPDDDEHSVCFNHSESQVYFCSEPKPLKHSLRYKKDTLDRYFSDFRERDGYRKFHRESWSELYSQMEHVFKTHDQAGFKKLSSFIVKEEDIVRKTAKLARLAFGADMLVYTS
jgi:hypothetical protein